MGGECTVSGSFQEVTAGQRRLASGPSLSWLQCDLGQIAFPLFTSVSPSLLISID